MKKTYLIIVAVLFGFAFRNILGFLEGTALAVVLQFIIAFIYSSLRINKVQKSSNIVKRTRKKLQTGGSTTSRRRTTTNLNRYNIKSSLCFKDVFVN